MSISDKSDSVKKSKNGQQEQQSENSEKQLETLVQNKGPNYNNGRLSVVPKASKALPRQKSMYDHVEIDFVKSGKKTYLFRLLVAGTHDEDPAEFMRYKRAMIDDINATCHDEMATGFFLAYPRQFIHVLEGSEETLNKYLAKCTMAFENVPEASPVATGPKLSIAAPETRPPKVRMVVLGYFAIQERFLPRWLCTKFNPPRETGEIVGGFRKNLFQLVRTTLILAIIMSKQPTMKNGEIDWPDQKDGPKTKERRDQDMQLMQYLPSQHVIMYVLKDKPRAVKLRTPNEFIRSYWEVPDLILSSETVWPIPCRIAPYD